MVTNSNFGKAGNGVIEKPAETKQSERGTTRMGGAAKQLPRTSSSTPLHEEIVSLDTVTGTIKRLGDKLQNMEKGVKALKDTTARLDQLKEEFKSRFGERVKEMEKDLQAFEDRLTGFNEKIKDAEKDASDAETIAEGLRTIVVETHQPTVQQTEEELSRSPQEVAQVKNSFTPAPSPQAAEGAKDISVQPSTSVNSQAPEGESSAESGLSEDTEKIPTESEATSKTDSESDEVAKLMEENEKTLESQGDEITQLEEIVKGALSKLGLDPLKHPVEPERESIERFSKYESATDSEKELLNRVDQHITETRKQEGRLEVLCEGVNRCLGYKGFEQLQKGKEPEEIVLEHPEKCTSFFSVVKMVRRAEEGVKRELEKQKDTIEKIGEALDEKIIKGSNDINGGVNGRL